MSTVSMVGCEPATMMGTESTDSMVTKERTRPTRRVWATCGRTISTSTRRRDAPRLRPASMVARSREAMAPASMSVTNGTCFHTKVMMMPRQSRRLVVCSGSSTPIATSELFIRPFFARNVRMHCAATMNGMNRGQR